MFSPEGKFLRRWRAASYPPLQQHEERQVLCSDWLIRKLLTDPYRQATRDESPKDESSSTSDLDVFARYRQIVLKASLLAVEGRLQREATVIHLVAQRLTDLSDRLRTLAEPLRGPAAANPLYPSRDFH